MAGRRFSRWMGAGRLCLGAGSGSGSSSSSYSGWGRSLNQSRISTGVIRQAPISRPATARTKMIPAPILLNTAMRAWDNSPEITPPEARAFPSVQRVPKSLMSQT